MYSIQAFCALNVHALGCRSANRATLAAAAAPACRLNGPRQRTSYLSKMNRSMCLRLLSWLVVLTALAGSRVVRAEELTADQLAARVVRGNGFTWEGATTRLRMILIEQAGPRSERALEV